MKYIEVWYYDSKMRECGTIYYGEISEDEAYDRFVAEFPEHKEEALFFRRYGY